MSKVIAYKEVASTSVETRVGFATTGGGHWEVWDRFITLDGKPAYHIGNICGTCSFLFQRLEGANDKISPSTLSERFRLGVNTLDDQILHAALSVIPAGKYTALLLKCVPRLVSPMKAGDYFCEENVALWGLDPFWDLPHDTRTEYYRMPTIIMSNQRALFEFVIPMFPSRGLNRDAVQSFESSLNAGDTPTALALSVLDVKQPSDWEGEPDVNQHLCLAHYLLDGHHKVYAASQTGKSIKIMSLLAMEKGVANKDEVAAAIEVLCA